MAKQARQADVRRRPSAPATKKRGKRRGRTHRTTVLLRWCVVGVVGLVGVLYYHPLTTYFETRATLNERAAEVAGLRAEKARLERRLEWSTTPEALSREARQMNLVRPGERLYIVRGIKEWRRAQAAQQSGATLRGDG